MGKSIVSEYVQYMEMLKNMTPYKIVDRYPCDDGMWYTVKLSKPASAWMREQPDENKEWYEHIDSRGYIGGGLFDITEELLLMVKLTWGE